MTAIDRLFVLWADPASGTRHAIGELWRDGSGYFFAYGHGVERAFGLGFGLMTEFSRVQEEDKPFQAPHLFSTFSQRIPSRKRFDFSDMMRAWGVENPGDPFEVLARSGGIRMTDRIELAEYRSDADDLSRPLSFRVAGVKHQDGVGAELLRVGDPVELVRERENPHDPHATLLIVCSGHRLGRVPRQYSPLFARLLDSGQRIDAVAERRLSLPEEGGRWVVRAQVAGRPDR
jgi:hypothetical protein